MISFPINRILFSFILNFRQKYVVDKQGKMISRCLDLQLFIEKKDSAAILMAVADNWKTTAYYEMGCYCHILIFEIMQTRTIFCCVVPSLFYAHTIVLSDHRRQVGAIKQQKSHKANLPTFAYRILKKVVGFYLKLKISEIAGSNLFYFSGMVFDYFPDILNLSLGARCAENSKIIY